MRSPPIYVITKALSLQRLLGRLVNAGLMPVSEINKGRLVDLDLLPAYKYSCNYFTHQLEVGLYISMIGSESGIKFLCIILDRYSHVQHSL